MPYRYLNPPPIGAEPDSAIRKTWENEVVNQINYQCYGGLYFNTTATQTNVSTSWLQITNWDGDLSEEERCNPDYVNDEIVIQHGGIYEYHYALSAVVASSTVTLNVNVRKDAGGGYANVQGSRMQITAFTSDIMPLTKSGIVSAEAGDKLALFNFIASGTQNVSYYFGTFWVRRIANNSNN